MSRLTKDNFDPDNNNRAMDGFNKLNQVLKELCDTFHFYCMENEMKFVITETVTNGAQDAALKRVSQSHEEGRAVDLRCKDWPNDFIEKFKAHFTEKYNHLGAVSKSDGVRRLIVDHVAPANGARHFHVQIGRDRI